MNDFTTGNPAKLILKFSIPLLIGNLFQQLYNMADAIIVGRYVSGNALAAVGSSGALLNFLVAVLIGLTTGSSVVISQLFGAKKFDELRNAVSTSIIFLGGLTLIMTAVGVFGAEFFMNILDVPMDIRDDAKTYIQIFMGGIIFPIYYNMYMAYLRALGDSRTPLYFLMFSVLLKVVLDMLFVAVFGMGVPGAAVATVISQALAFVATYYYAQRKSPILRIHKLTFDKRIFGLIVKFGLPAAVQMSVTNIGHLSIMRLVNSFGSVVVAGYTAATKIENIAMMPLSNLSAAISTFVGQNMGAGNEDRAKKGLFSGMMITLIIGAILTAFIFIAGNTLIAQFVNVEDIHAANIISVGTEYMFIMAMFYLLFGVFFSYNGFFRGAGDPVIVMVLTIASLAIRVICAYILNGLFDMGVSAVAWSIPIGWFTCTVAAIIYYRAGKWKGKSVVNAMEKKEA
ncbi:MAG: MATE family efflux transporter [Clostridiales bacterium]|nr:MATE family efflux transporter [Clostridiales bacterium]